MGIFSTIGNLFKRVLNNYNPYDAELRRIQTEENTLIIEAEKLCEEANRRLDSLSKSELESPAYKAWEEGGSVRFSVENKSYEQAQEEYWRVKHFIDSKTSTVEGTQQYLRNMAMNIGLLPTDSKSNMTSDLVSLQEQSKEFFDLASKIEQYLKNTEHSAIALDYQAIWQQISTYVRDENIDLEESTIDVEGLKQIVNNLIGLEAEEEITREMHDIYEEEKNKLLGQ